MGMDIRLPIGLMFSLFGVLLTAFGALGNKSIYSRSLGINVNFAWGLVLLAFGLIMLVLGTRRPAASRDESVADEKLENPVTAQTRGNA